MSHDQVALLAQEFERLASVCPGLTHVTVYSTVHWKPQDASGRRLDARIPDEFAFLDVPFEFPPFVGENAWKSSLKDPLRILDAANARSVDFLQFVIPRHFINITDWIGREQLGEGAFWIDQWPTNGGDWSTYLKEFCHLASQAGKSSPSNSQQRPAHSSLGCWGFTENMALMSKS